MFGTLRIGYAVFFCVVAAHILISLTFAGQSFGYYLVGFDGWGTLLWASPFLVWLGIIAVKITHRRIDRPTLTIWRIARRHRGWLLRAVVIAALIVPFARAYSALKTQIPSIQPFYADPIFIRMDRFLFLGEDPWVLTHRLFGPFATLVIDRIYILWFLFVMGLVAWFLFTRDFRFQLRALMTLILSWIVLGNIAATFLSSVGPCFYGPVYGPDLFAPLMERLRLYDSENGLHALAAQSYLLAHRSAENAGAGISAMPSLHVAVAFLTWICCRSRFGAKWPSWIAFAYFLVIWIGSVHLAWHYAVDGIFSVVGVAIIWWGSGKFVDWADKDAANSNVADGVAKPVVPLAA